MNVRAPLMKGQIPETYLLAAIGYETLVATKAARIVHAAEGREIIEFGTRRAHTPEAGVLGARAAQPHRRLRPEPATHSKTGYRYGIPVLSSTAAHSWSALAFASRNPKPSSAFSVSSASAPYISSIPTTRSKAPAPPPASASRSGAFASIVATSPNSPRSPHHPRRSRSRVARRQNHGQRRPG